MDRSLPIWESLASHYRVPDWFRDAKFGIWAHWGPQCQPEFGRLVRAADVHPGQLSWQQAKPVRNHLRHYGHPASTGFIDIIGRWKAEALAACRSDRSATEKPARAISWRWPAITTISTCSRAATTRWNASRVGPKRDILGDWERASARRGAEVRRLQPLQPRLALVPARLWLRRRRADARPPLRRLSGYDESDGRGKFWEGLDPQELYTGPAYVPPDGIDLDRGDERLAR